MQSIATPMHCMMLPITDDIPKPTVWLTFPWRVFLSSLQLHQLYKLLNLSDWLTHGIWKGISLPMALRVCSIALRPVALRRYSRKWPVQKPFSSVSSSTERSDIKPYPSTPLSQPLDKEINWDALSKDDAELFESLQAVVESLGDEATADHPMVEVRDKLATAFRDKAALLKRNWTDQMFQEGEEMNEEKVTEIEAAMVSDLGRSGGGLLNGKNLGNALDLVGVYMKNYKLDKADAVLSRCGPFVSQRGGVWMIKWLNHVRAWEFQSTCCASEPSEVVTWRYMKIHEYHDTSLVQCVYACVSQLWSINVGIDVQVSTVRMKQSRHLEALVPKLHATTRDKWKVEAMTSLGNALRSWTLQCGPQVGRQVSDPYNGAVFSLFQGPYNADEDADLFIPQACHLSTGLCRHPNFSLLFIETKYESQSAEHNTLKIFERLHRHVQTKDSEPWSTWHDESNRSWKKSRT